MITVNEREYLLRNIKETLEEYDYTYETDAVDSIIDKWATNKGYLIEAFKTYPNYVEGKFMIVFDTNYDREISPSALNNFRNWLLDVIPNYVEGLPDVIQQQKMRDGGCYLPNQLYDFIWMLHTLCVRTISEETADEINTLVPEVHAHAVLP